MGDTAQPAISMIDTVSKVLFRAMGLIVRMAPFGVLGAVADTVGQYGVGLLEQLLSLAVDIAGDMAAQPLGSEQPA